MLLVIIICKVVERSRCAGEVVRAGEVVVRAPEGCAGEQARGRGGGTSRRAGEAAARREAGAMARTIVFRSERAQVNVRK